MSCYDGACRGFDAESTAGTGKLSFGLGAPLKHLLQTFTTRTTGLLAQVRVGLECSYTIPVALSITSVDADGKPLGVVLAETESERDSAPSFAESERWRSFALTPPLMVEAGGRLAFMVSSDLTGCAIRVSVSDGYGSGALYGQASADGPISRTDTYQDAEFRTVVVE